MNNKNNIILLTVDSLRFDRLGFSGRTPSPSPAIDGIMRSGMSFTNFFVTGCPTQFSIPMMLSSTMPLDYGGCEDGLASRKISLPELYQSAGYATAGFPSGITLSHAWRLGRGFDEFHTLTDLPLILKTFRHVYFRYARNALKYGEMPFGDCIALLGPALGMFFDTVENFCWEGENDTRENACPASPLIHRWDHGAIRQYIREEKGRFTSDPSGYSARLLREPDLARVFDLSAFATSSADHLANNIHIGGKAIRNQTAIASAGFVMTRLADWVRENKGKPFFTWAHLMDIHYHNFTSFDMQNAENPHGEDVQAAARFLEHLETKKSDDGSDFEYDLSLNYVDRQISAFLDFLERYFLLDESIIVIASDHGSYSAKWPVRKEYDSAEFYDELYHVPAVIYERGMEPKTITGLTSAMDLAPTLLDMTGMDIPPEFQGQSALDGKRTAREYVIMEHTGRGPCDLSTKGVNICVRGMAHKVVYRTSLSGPTGGKVRAIHDLEKDPQERENLAGSPRLGMAVSTLLNVAEARAEEIRRQFESQTERAEGSPPSREHEASKSGGIHEGEIRLLMYGELLDEIEELKNSNKELQKVCGERLAVIQSLDSAIKGGYRGLPLWKRIKEALKIILR